MSDRIDNCEFAQRRIGGRPAGWKTRTVIAAGLVGMVGIAFWQFIEPKLVDFIVSPMATLERAGHRKF